MEAAGVTPVVLFLELCCPNSLIQAWEVLPDLRDILWPSLQGAACLDNLCHLEKCQERGNKYPHQHWETLLSSKAEHLVHTASSQAQTASWEALKGLCSPELGRNQQSLARTLSSWLRALQHHLLADVLQCATPLPLHYPCPDVLSTYQARDLGAMGVGSVPTDRKPLCWGECLQWSSPLVY